MKKKIKNYKVSCLGSVYKNSKLEEVKLSIESILNGSEKPDEIIIVIDGPIKSNLNKYLLELKKGKRLKICRNKNNLGLGLALNKGLLKCRGELICRFDTDDINLFNRIKISKEIFRDNQKLDILSSSVIEIIPSNEKLVKCNLKTLPINNKKIKKTLDIRNPINHPSVIFKKDKILDCGLYEDIKFFEDYYLWLKLRKANCNFKNINEPLVIMHRRSPSDRRTGLNYSLKELVFYIKAIKNNLVGPNFILLTPLKIFFRLMPSSLQYCYKLFPWRKNYSICKNPLYLKVYKFELLKIQNK